MATLLFLYFNKTIDVLPGAIVMVCVPFSPVVAAFDRRVMAETPPAQGQLWLMVRLSIA